MGQNPNGILQRYCVGNHTTRSIKIVRRATTENGSRETRPRSRLITKSTWPRKQVVNPLVIVVLSRLALANQTKIKRLNLCGRKVHWSKPRLLLGITANKLSPSRSMTRSDFLQTLRRGNLMRLDYLMNIYCRKVPCHFLAQNCWSKFYSEQLIISKQYLAEFFREETNGYPTQESRRDMESETDKP